MAVRGRLYFLIGAATVLIAVDLVAIDYVRSSVPSRWPELKLHLLGPLAGFPLIREDYFRAFGAVLLADFLFLRRNSAIVQIFRFKRSARVDVVYGLTRIFGLGLVVPVLLSAGIITILPREFAEWRYSITDTLPTLPRWGYAPAQVVFYTLIADFLRYWWHRWMHESKVLWPFHEVHHAATSFTLLTGNRVHAVEYLFALPTVVLPLILLGTSTGASLALLTALRIIDIAQHSMMPISMGWVGKWVIYAPVGHRIHHSPEPEHWDKNYGDILPIWDHIFGTWYDGDRVNDRVGIGDPEIENRGVIKHTLMPFDAALAAITSRSQEPAQRAET